MCSGCQSPQGFICFQIHTRVLRNTFSWGLIRTGGRGRTQDWSGVFRCSVVASDRCSRMSRKALDLIWTACHCWTRQPVAGMLQICCRTGQTSLFLPGDQPGVRAWVESSSDHYLGASQLDLNTAQIQPQRDTRHDEGIANKHAHRPSRRHIQRIQTQIHQPGQ